MFFSFRNSKLIWKLLVLLPLFFVACGDDDATSSDKPTPDNPDPHKPDNPTPDVPIGEFLPLHVEGRFIVNSNGTRLNLHGFAQTYSPWFNEQGSKWGNYDVDACLRYNKGLIDDIVRVGWKMSFVRIHMDPYWSNTPGVQTSGESDIHAFDYERFKTYLDEVFIPMAEYALSKNIYVVMRPPGVCPEQISIDGEYHQYLKRVWNYVSKHPKLKDNNRIMFELANEPIQICDDNGNALNNWDGRDEDARGQQIQKFMQSLVSIIRTNGCNNIILIPGLHYQMLYKTFKKYPVTGKNIGYAVHCYPGWYNSGAEDNVNVTYPEFKSGWDDQIGPVAEFAPVVVTEMDWAPAKYNCSWGKAVTGVAGGAGFGANFMKIADETGNVSWLLFTGPEHLAKYDNDAPDGSTFLTDPQACPRPVYRKYLYYASQEYANLINGADYK